MYCVALADTEVDGERWPLTLFVADAKTAPSIYVCFATIKEGQLGVAIVEGGRKIEMREGGK